MAGTAKKPGLFDLPQELLDDIFDCAYPEEQGVEFVAKRNWSHTQFYHTREDSSYQTRPFPTPKVCDFLVSKTFLQNAAKAWIGNQVIDALLPAMLSLGRRTESNEDLNLLFKYSRKVLWGLLHAEDFFQFSAVKEVRMPVESCKLLTDSKYPWQSVYDDEDIKKTEIYQQVCKFRGLTSFEAVTSDWYEIEEKSQTEQDIWNANLRKFEQLVTIEATKPKPEPELKNEQEQEQEPTKELDPEDDDSYQAKKLESQLLTRLVLNYANEGGPAQLSSSDIPDSYQDIVKMLVSTPKKFLDWVLAAKAKEQEVPKEDDGGNEAKKEDKGDADKDGHAESTEERPSKRQKTH
ncbi:hypothetical protein M409DRAFT_23253 [Zasmidium cellare ATCC 36951]|uniref:Uncharacterized protein n=1 Tax=Zasmidium cellare ATCC 36951 TaxID=1080233 RepID=A0A6A6CLM3_ZASCE|nr:uncharacterized protein M409DRAFT_23253 [Zasmidium cellare ATCC 36951]KAF2166619.1 hypothetical protein M409DRAFT_23253 [Zasmidium cellare ATCC 36951]